MHLSRLPGQRLWLIWIQFLKAIADPRLIYYCIDRSPSSIAQWLVAIFQDEVLDPVFGFAIARTTRYIGIRDSAKSFVAKSGFLLSKIRPGAGGAAYLSSPNGVWVARAGCLSIELRV